MNNFLLGQPWALKLVWAVNVQNYTILPGTLTSMNVELVGGQEVFRQHADGMAPQAQLLPGMLRPQSGSRPGPQGPSHIWLPRVEAWSQTPEVQRET